MQIHRHLLGCLWNQHLCLSQAIVSVCGGCLLSWAWIHSASVGAPECVWSCLRCSAALSACVSCCRMKGEEHLAPLYPMSPPAVWGSSFVDDITAVLFGEAWLIYGLDKCLRLYVKPLATWDIALAFLAEVQVGRIGADILYPLRKPLCIVVDHW